MRFIFILLLNFILFPVFGQRTEKQGWYVHGYNESYAKDYFNNNTLDKIEGIWQSTDGFKYAIEKSVSNIGRIKNRFRVIILESSVDGWEPTEIKGFVEYGSINDVYSMKYYTKSLYDGSDLSSQNVLLVFENPSVLSFHRLDGIKITLYKLYPTIDKSRIEQNPNINTPSEQWSGSCVAIGRRLIATNYHVVEKAANIVVSGFNGDYTTDYNAEVVLSDKFNDLAVLKITDYRFDGFNIKYGIGNTVSDVGTSIFVLGYPLTTTMGENIKLTTGVISSKTGFQGDVSQYQISAPIQPGNSGGPLFDNQGNLIGIVSAKHIGAENVGYAIKISYLLNLIDSSNEPMDIKTVNSITALSLPDKIKMINPCVLLVKVNANSNRSNFSSGKNVGTKGTEAEDRMSMAQSFLDSANEKYQNGDINGAYNDACQSVNIYPNPVSHFRKGYIACFLDSLDSAIESMEYCLSYNHRSELCWEILSRAYCEKENWLKALEFSEKVLEYDRKNILVLEVSGVCKGKLGRVDDAILDYIQAIKFDGVIDYNFCNIYNNLAYEFMKKGEFDKSKEYITKSFQHSHMYGNAWDTYGELCYRLGNYNKCIECMNNSITIAQFDKKSNWIDNSYLYRGLAKKQLGFFLGAYNDLEISSKKGNEYASYALREIDKSTFDVKKDNAYNKVFANPPVRKNSSRDFVIKGVEVCNEYTALYCQYTNTDNGPFGYYTINRDAYILDKHTKDKLYLLGAENCSIFPKTKNIRLGETKSFVLYFPSISNKTTEIDFIESDKKKDNWKCSGIKLK